LTRKVVKELVTEDNVPVPNKITSGKYRGMMTLSDECGVIAALAIAKRICVC
jgi:hypothetical protein